MATLNLGAIRYNWKGAYSGSTAYVVNDVVSDSGNSYVCIQAGTGQAVGNATAYWNIMSSAGTNGSNGTNGTDVGTVITTQGDMLYRDGSGLQRLAKGTASQELRMNSGATAPEWHTPAVASSDFVKLSTSTPSGVSQFDITGLFNASTYSAYKIILKELRGAGDEIHLRAQFLNTNNAINSGYKFSRVETFAHYAGSHAIEHHHDHSSPCIRFAQTNIRTSGGYESGAFEIDFYNFGSAGNGNGNCAWRGVFYSGGQGESYNISGSALTDQSFTSANGIRFYDNNGNNCINGKAIVYGIK